MKHGRLWTAVFLMVVFWTGISVRAEELTFDAYDFNEIQSFLEESFGKDTMNFKELVQNLADAKGGWSLEAVADTLTELLFGQIRRNRGLLGRIMILAISAAVFSNIASVFRDNQISQNAWFVIYLMLSAALFAGFGSCYQAAAAYMESLLTFIRLLVPAFYMALSCVCGAVATGAYYQLTFLLIAVLDWLFLYLILPGIRIYVCLYLFNELTGENYLSGFLQLLQLLFDWIIRTVSGVVIGLQVIQGLILPAAGQMQGQFFSKLIQAVPGIGSGVRSASEILLGTGILIKNGIGAAGCLVIGAICVFPLIQMAVVVFLYYAVGAVIQPVSDTRITNCITGTAFGIRLLLKSVSIAAFLFAVSIALICVFTNRVF